MQKGIEADGSLAELIPMVLTVSVVIILIFHWIVSGKNQWMEKLRDLKKKSATDEFGGLGTD